MNTNNRYRVPTNGEGIRELLKVAGFSTPDKEGLTGISQTEGSKFALALTRVANKESDIEVQRDYLDRVVKGASQSTRDSLSTIGIPIPETPVLIEIAKREGRAFFNALRIVEENAGDRQGIANARAYLDNLIEEYGGGSMEAPARMEPQPHNRVAESRPISEPASSPPASRQDQSLARRPVPLQEDKTPKAKDKGEPAREFGKSYKVYGDKAAVCFAETTTRTGDIPTITIEFAVSADGNYDWKNKWAIQLTPAELYLVYGLWMGLVDEMTLLELKGHGTNNEKSLKMTYQGNQFFFVMFSRGKPPRAVPVLAKDIALPIVMVGQQIIAGSKSLTWEMLGTVAKRICTMHGNKNVRQQDGS